jgi:hypothetical protein
MKRALVLLAIAAIVACGGPDPIPENTENASKLPDVGQPSASPTGAAPAEGTAAGNIVSSSASNLPTDLQGRWGLTPGDCMAAHGDEGLLTISANEVRFYESVAVPAANVQTSAKSISGDFAFTGEGQQWSKHLSLELRDDKLVRTEREPLAAFRYVRC